jgi:hypothetical protein
VAYCPFFTKDEEEEEVWREPGEMLKNVFIS